MTPSRGRFAQCLIQRHEYAAQTMVGRRGLEPRTYGLKVHSSAIELAARDHRVPVGGALTWMACASAAFVQVVCHEH